VVVGVQESKMNTSISYQVAIIGGGLAGLTLAIQLRKAGLAVVLFEKEKYPFHKVCGEYISMESWDFLERLGVPLSAMNLPKITRLHITAPNGNKLSHQLKLGGFGISRYKLDYTLYLLAKNLGVEVVEECRVNDVQEQLIFTTHGHFKAQCIVGSWGKRSKMDASLIRDFQQPQNRRLNNYVGIKYHVQADLPDNLIELHNFKNGYCGISKIEDNKYCMCYLVKGDELKEAGNSIKQLEETVLQKNPFLNHYFRSFPSLYEKPLSISQISFEQKTLQENHILMVGDAAGLITPLCGNGMSMAMHASFLLANQLTSYFDGTLTWQQVEMNYTHNWQKQFANRIKTGRFIQSLFGNELLTNATLQVLKPFPKMVNWLVTQTHGKPF
jgi:flavin-dependent dehydrogenase